MNPETGISDRVMGTTADGIHVFERHGLLLRFAWFTSENIGESGLAFGISWQTNENGRKRPHLWMHLGDYYLQSGWLFG